MRTLIESQQAGQKTNTTPRSYIAVRKQGTQFRAEISTALVTFNEKPAIQGLLRDVTEKERLHAKLQQAQRLESVGTLAGGVAHDFNNLLMAIQGNASLALTRLETSHSAYEKLRNITTYVEDAAALTKQLLGFARGGKYEVKATQLNDLIQKTAQMFGRTKKEITIRIKPQQDLWSVAVDRGQIEQVLLNLLVNACQAMPNGGKIYIQTSNVILDSVYAKAYNVKPGEYTKTTVTDTGLGMDKAIQNKIFEPFFTTKDRGRGTGLGLASAYGIIKNHDGIINVYSEKGKGTTFTIYLPATEMAEITGEKSHISPLRGTETVLIVDDEEIILNIATELLEELGYQTRIARTGFEAVDVYQQQQDEIDMVILDMVMPGMSGEETYEKIYQMNPEVKALLASGYSIDDKASKILRNGCCNGFIQKPYNIEELSRKLRELLD
jgi:signal transduction histidine kinase